MRKRQKKSESGRPKKPKGSDSKKKQKERGSDLLRRLLTKHKKKRKRNSG